MMTIKLPELHGCTEGNRHPKIAHCRAKKREKDMKEAQRCCTCSGKLLKIPTPCVFLARNRVPDFQDPSASISFVWGCDLP